MVSSSVIAYGATSTLLDIVAIYFAYSILQCEKVSSKWVLYLFMVMHILSLLVNSGLIINAHNSNNQLLNLKSSQSVSILMIVFILLFFFRLFIDIYFLFKLFSCNTTNFIIYIIVYVVNSIAYAIAVKNSI